MENAAGCGQLGQHGRIAGPFQYRRNGRACLMATHQCGWRTALWSARIDASPSPASSRSRCWHHTQLLQHTQVTFVAPVFYYPARDDSTDIDARHGDLPPGRRDTEEEALMGAAKGAARHDLVALGD